LFESFPSFPPKKDLRNGEFHNLLTFIRNNDNKNTPEENLDELYHTPQKQWYPESLGVKKVWASKYVYIILVACMEMFNFTSGFRKTMKAKTFVCGIEDRENFGRRPPLHHRSRCASINKS